MYQRVFYAVPEAAEGRKSVSFFFGSAYSRLSQFVDFGRNKLSRYYKAERGFQKVVDACAADIDVFLFLICKSQYMRVI
jgi:hypothetical protein